jgi:hypothetical protein
MYNIIEKRVGDFIDLDHWFREINDESIDLSERDKIADKFLLLLLGRKPNENEIVEAVANYIKEVETIKTEAEWIYNPPPPPSTTKIKNATVGDEYRKEFAEDYSTAELIYLMCTVLHYKPNEVLEMSLNDFFYWVTFLLRKKWCEQIE